MHRYLVDAALTTLGESLRGAGSSFEVLQRAWSEELECGHKRGEAKPHWLTEKEFGVFSIPRHLLKTRVEAGVGEPHDPRRSMTAVICSI